MTRSAVVSWKPPCELRLQRGNEVDGGAVRTMLIADHRSTHPHQRAVGAPALERIDQQVRLVRVFAGNGPSASLVPIQHDLPLTALLDQVSVDGQGTAVDVQHGP